MNPLTVQLAELCEKHRLEKKLLIVPSRRMGHQLLQTLVMQGKSYINLSVVTLEHLAHDHCKSYMHKHNLQLIPPTLAKHYLFGILESLQESGQLHYFHEIKISPSFVQTIYSSLMDLKMSCFTSDSISEKCFVNHHKGTDIKLILQAYNDKLKHLKFLDSADVLSVGLTLPPSTDTSTIYTIPASLQLSNLEKQYLDYLSQAKCYEIGKRSSELDLQGANIQMVKAFGEMNEAKATFRTMKAANIPVDQYAVFYTSREPYTQYFFELSERYQLPVTFGEGISIQNTRPGRLFFTVLKWMKDRYSVKYLITLLNQGDLQLDESLQLHSSAISRMLRTAGIGWEIKRYLPQIHKQVNEFLQKSADASDEEKAAYYQERGNDYIRLYDWLGEFLEDLPASMDSQLSLRTFATSLIRLIEKHSRISNERDAAAKASILDELSLFKQYASETLPAEEALRRIEDIIEQIRVGVSSPKPGHLHVDHYRSGMYLGRKHHVVVGLDNRKFPGGASDDPILLDNERGLLGRDLPLLVNQIQERISEVTQLLSSQTESLLLSYSCSNPLENKEQYPASVMLQVYRRMNGDDQIDYSQFIRHFSKVEGYIPSVEAISLDENEWWMNQTIQLGKIENSLEVVLDTYPTLRSGFNADQARNSLEFTKYDGKINAVPEELDPRLNKEIALSASKLQTLASCPYSFFLKQVLGIKEPDDIEYRPGAWLNSADRGTVLHAIFERFLTSCKEQGIRPKVEQHLQELCQLADEILAEYKELTPAPSHVVFEKEREEILASCKVFLAMEEEIESIPEHFELVIDKQNTPVEILLPSGSSYLVSGKIDRVDVNPDGTYSILDYKTGSTYSYKPKEIFKGGRQLQHAMYAIAFEEFARKYSQQDREVTVSRSGYVFPTVKGEGASLLRPQSNKDQFLTLNEKLLDILATGHFTMTDTKDDCKYCHYHLICNRHLVDEDVLAEKRNDRNANGLTAFREVRTYV